MKTDDRAQCVEIALGHEQIAALAVIGFGNRGLGLRRLLRHEVVRARVESYFDRIPMETDSKKLTDGGLPPDGYERICVVIPSASSKMLSVLGGMNRGVGLRRLLNSHEVKSLLERWIKNPCDGPMSS